MKKSFKIIAGLLAAMFAAAPLAGCGGKDGGEKVTNRWDPVIKAPEVEVTPENDTNYGELRIADVEVALGETKELFPLFTRYLHKSEITYTFEGEDISIDNKKDTVTANAAGKQITVTAKTSKLSTTFKVTTVQNHEIKVADVISWEGYAPSEFTVRFDGEEEDVTYEYDETKLTLDSVNRTVIGKEVGVFDVKVKAGEKETTFKVEHKVVDKTGKNARKWDSSAHDEHVGNMRKKYADEATENTTLFIGDSFFDVRWFWTNFYTTYAGKDAILAGSGGATTYDWEQYAHTFLKEAQPKQIVVTVGTNNLYDDQEDAETAYESLQRMFQVIHSILPETQIYYFSIVHRYNLNDFNKISTVNGCMRDQFCAGKDWIKFIDVSGQVSFDRMMSDKIHPLLETYSVYVNALDAAGLVLSEKDTSTIADRSFEKTEGFDKRNTVVYQGAELARYFVLQGKLDITDSVKNAHVAFALNNSDRRFLIWNRDSADGIFTVGCQQSGTAIDDCKENAFTKTAGNTLTLYWKIVITDNDAYFYVGDTEENVRLRAVYVAIPVSSPISFALGTEGVTGRLYDMTAKTLVDDAAEYNALIEECSEEIGAYGVGTDESFYLIA